MRRLSDDLEQPSDLREALQRSRAAGQDYATADKLAQLKAALSDPARQPLGESSRFADAWRHASHPGWKLAALLAVGGTAALMWPASRPEPQLKAAPAENSELVEQQPSVPAPAAAAPAPEVAPAPTAVPSSSRREIAQLVRIRALIERDPAAAQRLAQRSEREFPGGLLSEERQALSIVALAKSGARAAAASKARDFFARFPQSPLRELIEAELGRARP